MCAIFGLVAVRRGIRERLGRAVRWAGRRPIAVLAVIAVVAAPAMPPAAAAGAAASAQPLAAVVAPLPGPDGSIAVSPPGDNTADETPDDDSFRPDRTPTPLQARVATLDSGQADGPTRDVVDARPAVDDAFLAGVYRCNPDGRGPPPGA
jgi:hypothetical protein